MTIFDKASWQIDGGIPENLVISHFCTVFKWLYSYNMLSEEGKEELDEGIDNCASLNENMVTDEGFIFLEKCYDEYLEAISKDKYGKNLNGEELEKIYNKYMKK